ncbi:VirB8, partial [mine drainage metagenome]
LLALVPLKRVEPYVIRVDSRTGVVDVVPAYDGREDFNQAIARYFLMRYISVCERFDYAMARADYRQCGAFNSAPLNQALYTRWDPSNPRSPLNVHRDGGTVSVRIESVSFLGAALGGGHLAQVRFERIARQPGGERRASRALDCHDPVRVRSAGACDAVAALESTRLRSHRARARAGSARIGRPLGRLIGGGQDVEEAMGSVRAAAGARHVGADDCRRSGRDGEARITARRRESSRALRALWSQPGVCAARSGRL